MAGDLVVIGRVTRPHGVRGEVRVLPFTESAASFQRYRSLYLRPPQGPAELVGVSQVRPHKNFVLLKLSGVQTQTAAAALVGAEVLVRRAWLPSLDPDEYYWADLIGLAAFDEQGQSLGRVVRIFSTAAHDVLVLEAEGREILLPFRGEIILAVDLERGRLLVRPPEGLIEP